MYFARDLQYNRTRVLRDDNSFYNVVEVIVKGTNTVQFHKGINEQTHTKLNNVAQLKMLKAMCRKVEKPVVIAWDAYPHSEKMREIDLSLGDTALVHVSKNSTITYHLRDLIKSRNYVIDQGKLTVKDLVTGQDRVTKAILDTLWDEKRIKVYQANPDMTVQEIHESLDPYKDLIAVGRVGFPSSYARSEDYGVVFNTSYFLFEEEDYISDFSLFGDAYNLQICKGVIQSPPIYNRSALLITLGGEIELKQISLQDLRMSCLGEEWDLKQFALNELADFALYTRYYGIQELGRTIGQTPLRKGQIDFVIIDQAIVGFKRDGGIEIPQNGFVLSIPASRLTANRFSNCVEYAFSDGRSYLTGIQCGPGLLNNGEVILDKDRLASEQFYRKRCLDGAACDYGVVPTDYAADIDKTRAARVAIGVDTEGDFRVLAVEAVNKGAEESSRESSGVTLHELALLAKSRNYKFALNLDGGGSANIHYLHGQLLRGADRRGLPGIMYERMVPSVGVVQI